MSQILAEIRDLVSRGDVRISDHGYTELALDDISAMEVVQGLKDAMVVEDYPDYPKGRCVLVLQKDSSGDPIHAVWGIPKGKRGPAVLITAYRPDPFLWEDDFLRRRP
jgi:Domain of unknown function (DUF4258)